MLVLEEQERFIFIMTYKLWTWFVYQYSTFLSVHLGEMMTDGINPLNTCTCICVYHSMLNVYIIPMDHYFKQNVI